MKTARWLLATAASVALSSCGGGSAPSSPVTIPGGTVTPAPTPAPTPSPIPTPSGTAQAENVGATPCFVYLYTSATLQPADVVGGGYCDFQGRFAVNGSIDGSSFGTVRIAQHQNYFVKIFGVDRASSMWIAYTAPKGSVIFSPVTSLAAYAGGQAAVKRALGLDGGLFSLATDRDLITFSVSEGLQSPDAAVRADAERLAAANLRVLAVTIPLNGNTPYSPATPAYDRLGSFVGANPAFLFNNAAMTNYWTGVWGSTYHPRVVSAVAHLINAYAATIPVRIADDASARKYMLGIYGYLAPELQRLLTSNSPTEADAALAVTTTDILAAIAVFQDGPAFPTSGRFFPAPNFFEATSNLIYIRGDGNGNPDPGGQTVGSGTLEDNDLFAQGIAEGPTGFFPNDSTVTGVSVPAAFSSSISASLLDFSGSHWVEVRALNGFRGRAAVDYQVRYPTGATGTARVYLNFR